MKINMFKKNKFIVLGFMLILMLLFIKAKRDVPVNVTYLGNCGFLYECSGKKVLIDPFGNDFGDFFSLPSNETKNKIITGSSPFDNIDLLLVTHIHEDHFDVRLTEAFLYKHPDIKMICPTQVFNQMQDSCANFEKIRKQIESPEIERFHAANLNINDIHLQAIRMQHGAMRSLEGVDYSEYSDYEKTEDWGYVIDMCGTKIFHQGDGSLKINRKALDNITTPVDIACLSYFDWDSASLTITKNELGAKNVIFMHGTKPGKELETEELKKISPELIFFKEELESKRLGK